MATDCEAASEILPNLAVMMPLFTICGANKAAIPPSLIAILPLFMMLAVPPENRSSSVPLIISVADTSWVAAINAAASMTELSPKTTPLPLMISSLPVACICPNICDGSCPITLLAVTDSDDG